MSADNSFPPATLTHVRNVQCAADADPLIQHFLLQFQSTHTRRSYSNDLHSFFEWWQQRSVDLRNSLESINEKHILLWLEQFTENSTRARKLASLSSFFQFCERRKGLPGNPCLLLKRPGHTTSRSAQALTEQETTQLLQHLHTAAFQPTAHGAHAQRRKQSAHLRFAVLHTLFSVGMRVDELCELRMCDLLFTEPHHRLRFTTKGGDEHTVIVPASCAQVILTYLETCRPQTRPDDFLFARVQTTKRPVKLSQTAIFTMIRESACEAGINKSLSPHSARATVATVLHRQGVPLGFIQSLLNHKQITTTAHYVKKANERDESAALKAPVSKWLNTPDES